MYYPLIAVGLIEKSIKVVKVYYPQLINGMINTMLVALAGTLIGLVIGLLIGAIRYICGNKDNKDKKTVVIIKKIGYFITSCYVEIFRGTPMLVQAMFLFWFLKPYLGWTAFTAAICIISINTGSYMSEIVRSGIQSVDKGQFEGSRSLGLSAWQTMRYVVLPQAIKNAFPSIGNEFIVNIKDSCVLNAIGFAELFFQAKSISGSMFDYTAAYFVVGIIYFILTFTTSRVLMFIERKIGMQETSFPASVTMPKEEVR